MNPPVTTKDPKRALTEDADFLANLAGLDHGMDKPSAPADGPDVDHGTGYRRNEPPRPARSALPPSPPVPLEPGGRPFFDLFSPEMLLPDQSPSEAGPAILPGQRLVMHERRAIPFLDEPPEINPRPSQTSDPLTGETFDGLHEQPFSLSADPRFLYHSVGHDRLAQAMLDAIRQRNGILVLTGEPGVGKTILCRAVMDQLDRRTLTSFLADPFDTVEDLLKTLLVDFGVISSNDVALGRQARASRADLLVALRDFLFTLAPLQAFAVVVIDEAQHLSVELLEQVRVASELGGDKQLLLILVGRPALSATLARRELRQLIQRVSARWTLGPLASDEVAAYITHRLEVAGTRPRIEFDAPSIARLYELSGGVPRLINLLCDRAMAVGQAASASMIDERVVDSAAEDLDLAPSRSRRSLGRVAATLAVLALLCLIGAAAGAFVFRTDLSALISQWEAAPAPPAEVHPALSPPYKPAPPSEAEQQIR